MYKHKEYGMSIQFVKVKPLSRKHAKEARIIEGILNWKIAQMNICSTHIFHYTLFGDHYRLYRRGKNRCKHCGVKLHDSSSRAQSLLALGRSSKSGRVSR